MLKFFCENPSFLHKKCTQSWKQHSNMIKIHCINGLCVCVDWNQRNRDFIKCLSFFVKTIFFSPKMHSTMTKVILTDKGVHTESCVSISRMGTKKQRSYGHFKKLWHLHKSVYSRMSKFFEKRQNFHSKCTHGPFIIKTFPL